MKVLFCTDGSETSYYAIKKALPFLHKEDQIFVISIIDWGILPTYVTFPAEKEDIYPQYKSIAENILNKSIKILEMNGFSVSGNNYLYGPPAKTILDILEEECYDLVILGSHGKKGVKKWLGSVSAKVVTKSAIPGLIVKQPVNTKEISSIQSKNVLFAIDGSEFSFFAVERAISMLNMAKSTLQVLIVKPGPESLPFEIIMDKEWSGDCMKKEEEIAEEALKITESIINKYNLSINSTISLEGDAAEVILNYIEENNQDLLVMGSHGREGFSDLILGSVSKRVLDHASCPVLIVPTKGKSICK